MARAAWFMVIASMAITVFLRLAIHVVTHNSRRPTHWVFGVVLFWVRLARMTSLQFEMQ